MMKTKYFLLTILFLFLSINAIHSNDIDRIDLLLLTGYLVVGSIVYGIQLSVHSESQSLKSLQSVCTYGIMIVPFIGLGLINLLVSFFSFQPLTNEVIGWILVSLAVVHTAITIVNVHRFEINLSK